MFRQKQYTVKLTGRAGLIYSEGSRHMHIDSELLAGPTFDIVIYSDSLKNWDDPFDTETLSEADIGRIKANISEALSNMRIDWQ